MSADLHDHLAMMLYGCWLEQLSNGRTLSAEAEDSLCQRLNGNAPPCLQVGAVAFNFRPHVKKYIVILNGGESRPVWAISSESARRAVGWHNVAKVI